jgi:hypothetical protein
MSHVGIAQPLNLVYGQEILQMGNFSPSDFWAQKHRRSWCKVLSIAIQFQLKLKRVYKFW